MGSCKIIEFKGAKILYTDVRNCNTEQCKEVFNRTTEVIKDFPPKSVLSLVNLTGASINTSIINNVRENVSKNNDKVLATAVVGLTGFQRTILDTIITLTGRKVGIMDSYEEARLWLLDERQKHEKKLA